MRHGETAGEVGLASLVADYAGINNHDSGDLS